jgi:hypothetical protein
MTMAANTTVQRVKAKKRVDVKQQVSAKPRTSNLAAQTRLGCSADDTDACCKSAGLAEALRDEGIDERAIAHGFATLHSKLSGSEDKGDLKLFFDVLKENHRTLEPPSASEHTSANDGPVTIVLRHNMARPARETKTGTSDPDRLSTSGVSEGHSFAKIS